MSAIQNPQDIYQQLSKVLEVAAKIPIILLLIFGICCGTFLTFFLIYRITSWLYITLLWRSWI